ncbi:hypothetical protein [Edaphobacillus lindanitolerans]|uniref:HIT domain-containing protein n=1 Tax=Edaphobacillus lindanitolerans TaxID=550447 RepID=A0A1U7PPE5_9BACI|nr:hypothetical protein [Edaphobacillus lindanitolerans]SIT88179.1 hypothetical protein SAMN05428946_2235 [Edaphobacillus lindanitolerans]
MITDRQLVIDNLEDKLKAFTHAVGGELTSEADFVISNDGITVFQEGGLFKDVEHYHMHIVPRFKGDDFQWVEPDIDRSAIDFASLEEKLRDALTGREGAGC